MESLLPAPSTQMSSRSEVDRNATRRTLTGIRRAATGAAARAATGRRASCAAGLRDAAALGTAAATREHAAARWSTRGHAAPRARRVHRRRRLPSRAGPKPEHDVASEGTCTGRKHASCQRHPAIPGWRATVPDGTGVPHEGAACLSAAQAIRALPAVLDGVRLDGELERLRTRVGNARNRTSS